MPNTDGALRRRRILKDREDRLALITGRHHALPSPPPPSPNFTAQSSPSVSPNRAPQPRLSPRSQDKHNDEAAQLSQNGRFASGSSEESFLQRHKEAGNEAWSICSSEQLITTLLNLFGPISSKQVSFVVAATQQLRMVFSITMAFLVLMSHFEFPIVGNKIIRSIILFRPLLLLLLTNTALIVIRLLPDMRGGEKADTHKLKISGGIGWVEEAGRAVEVGMMVHDVLKTLFMDFVVYSLIIICGFCLAS